MYVMYINLLIVMVDFYAYLFLGIACGMDFRPERDSMQEHVSKDKIASRKKSPRVKKFVNENPLSFR